MAKFLKCSNLSFEIFNKLILVWLKDFCRFPLYKILTRNLKKTSTFLMTNYKHIARITSNNLKKIYWESLDFSKFKINLAYVPTLVSKYLHILFWLQSDFILTGYIGLYICIGHTKVLYYYIVCVAYICLKE